MNATERALRDALHGIVAQPHLPESLAERVAVSYGRRRRRRGAMTVAAVAAGVIAAVALPGLGGTPRPQPPATASPSFSRPPAPAGPRVAATGTVVAAPGEQMRFCDISGEAVTHEPGPWPSPLATPRAPTCAFSGVAVNGVDLNVLGGRREIGGVVFGRAWLKGVLRDGTLTVVEQEAPRAAPAPAPTMGLGESPCAPPPGGWAADSPQPEPAGDGTTLYDQPSLGPLDRFADANPGEIVYVRYVIPVRNHSVVMTAVRNVAKVEAALRPVYGPRICIVQSRYAKDDVRQARRALTELGDTPDGRAAGVWDAGETQTPEGQPRVDAKAAFMIPALERLLTQYPPGLVHVDVWLRPAD
ncbi:MAG TPA: hypothetical protein VNQ77_01150 [Frankiaceae bacterium]|nr:hypothetical protein [Frankiaceae bacterium]